MNRNALMRDMTHAFGVGAIAVRREPVRFKIARSATPRVANESAVFIRGGCGRRNAVRVRLVSVENQGNRNIYGVGRIDLVRASAEGDLKLHVVLFCLLRTYGFGTELSNDSQVSLAIRVLHDGIHEVSFFRRNKKLCPRQKMQAFKL